jgi:GNAT superfamily N-acetyltransferase
VLPGPVPGSYLPPLTPADGAEVAVLQRCCWVDEAISNDTLAIAALHESLAQVGEWLHTWHAWGLWQDGRLLGMVRARRVDDEWHVGRLGVVPDLRGRGVGRWLLRVAEDSRAADSRRIVLFTGARSRANVSFYKSEGYRLVADSGEPGAARLDKTVTGTECPTGTASIEPEDRLQLQSS